MRSETITWHDLPDDGMPDADETVLVAFTTDDGHIDTWLGWWSGEHWMDASTGDQIEREGSTRVVAWAPAVQYELPA